MTNLALTTSEATIFTASGAQAVPGIVLCNTSATVDTTVTMYLKPSASAGAAGTMVLNALPLKAGESVGLSKFFGGFLMDTTNVLSAKMGSESSAAVTVTVSSVAL